jgi:hypothetical protein
MQRYKRALLCWVLCVCGLIMPAAAADPAPNPAASWNLKQLMLELGQVRSAKARFVERKYLSLLKEPLEFSGTLLYAAPGRVEKKTLTPKPESFVVDQDKLIVERDAQRRTLSLQDYPEIWAFVESIRGTLAGDLQTLNRFYKVDLDGGPDEWQLLLQPSERKMQAIVKSIRISGSKSVVHTIEIDEADGDRSVMTVIRDDS